MKLNKVVLAIVLTALAALAVWLGGSYLKDESVVAPAADLKVEPKTAVPEKAE